MRFPGFASWEVWENLGKGRRLFRQLPIFGFFFFLIFDF